MDIRAPVPTITEHEALIYVMVMQAAVDRAMSDRELRVIGDIVRNLPIFADYDQQDLIRTAQDCGSRLQRDNGLHEVLGLVADALPVHLHDTAYALAVEVAASDLRIEEEELRLLELLRSRLGLDKLTVAAIEHSTKARYRRL